MVAMDGVEPPTRDPNERRLQVLKGASTAGKFCSTITLESAGKQSAPDCISGVRISNSRDRRSRHLDSQLFTFRIHGIRGFFVNARPFATIALVEPLLFW